MSSVSAPFPSIPDALESPHSPSHPDTTLTLPHIALTVQYTCNMFPPSVPASVAVLTISHSFLRRFLRLLMRWKALTRTVILPLRLHHRLSCFVLSSPPSLVAAPFWRISVIARSRFALRPHRTPLIVSASPTALFRALGHRIGSSRSQDITSRDQNTSFPQASPNSPSTYFSLHPSP
jgi:hypothetical protein